MMVSNSNYKVSPRQVTPQGRLPVLFTGRFAQKPVPPWDDSTGTIRAKNRTGRFAQKKNWDDSLKFNIEIDSPNFVKYIYIISVLLGK